MPIKNVKSRLYIKFNFRTNPANQIHRFRYTFKETRILRKSTVSQKNDYNVIRAVLRP